MLGLPMPYGCASGVIHSGGEADMAPGLGPTHGSQGSQNFAMLCWIIGRAAWARPGCHFRVCCLVARKRLCPLAPGLGPPEPSSASDYAVLCWVIGRAAWPGRAVCLGVTSGMWTPGHGILLCWTPGGARNNCSKQLQPKNNYAKVITYVSKKCCQSTESD